MKVTEKAPVSAATLTGAKTGAGTRQTTTSINNFTTTARSCKMRISDFLGHGQTSAVPLRQLITMTGLDSRTVRQQIERERRNGCPIVSDCQHGYWLAESRTEIETFCRSMRARAFEIQRTAALVQLAELEAGNDS